MTTSADVARVAGVSTATVSRVLSGSTRISDTTTARVLAAAQALGYEPNVLAQGLAKKHARTIALGIFSSDEHSTTRSASTPLSALTRKPFYYFLGVLQSIEAEAAALGYDLLLPSGSSGTLDDYVRNLKSRKVAGAIVMPLHTTDPRIQTLLQSDIPTVFVELIARACRATYVKVDHVSGAFGATHHLLQLGHRRIVLLTGHESSVSGTERP